MELNTKKTKVMVVITNEAEAVNVVVKELKLEHVEEYKYLGSWVTTNKL